MVLPRDINSSPSCPHFTRACLKAHSLGGWPRSAGSLRHLYLQAQIVKRILTAQKRCSLESS